MRKLTLEQVDDICWIHNYMNAMPPEHRPYFKWWITEITNGTIKVPRAILEETIITDYPQA